MADSVRLRSLAKINLDLRVLQKRADGFHELRTIFQTVSLADTIELEYRPGRTRIDLNSDLNIPDNIIVRAIHSVLEATGKTGLVGVRFFKRIPMGGGLGGGSSNAATILLALPLLMRLPLPLPKLIELAAELGSDVPFFLLGGTAAGLGRGTELYPLPDLPARHALLVAPGLHLSTAEAYRGLARGSQAPAEADRAFQSTTWRVADPAAWPEWRNDFESIVFRQHPQLKLMKGKLQKLGARPALMSGSGSTLFGIFPSRELRDRAVVSFRKSFVARGQETVHPVTIVNRNRYQTLWRRQLGVPLDSKVWPPQDRYAE